MSRPGGPDELPATTAIQLTSATTTATNGWKSPGPMTGRRSTATSFCAGIAGARPVSARVATRACWPRSPRYARSSSGRSRRWSWSVATAFGLLGPTGITPASICSTGCGPSLTPTIPHANRLRSGHAPAARYGVKERTSSRYGSRSEPARSNRRSPVIRRVPAITASET